MGLYWINRERFRLGIMSRPSGYDWLSDDLRILRQAGVDVIVSALTGPKRKNWVWLRKLTSAFETVCFSSHSLWKIDLCRHMLRSSQSWWTGRWNTQEQGNP